MTRNKLSIWSEEVQYGEIYESENHQEFSENLLTDAYEAINRFCQKEIKRSKTPKRRKHCWQ